MIYHVESPAPFAMPKRMIRGGSKVHLCTELAGRQLLDQGPVTDDCRAPTTENPPRRANATGIFIE